MDSCPAQEGHKKDLTGASGLQRWHQTPPTPLLLLRQQKRRENEGVWVFSVITPRGRTTLRTKQLNLTSWTQTGQRNSQKIPRTVKRKKKPMSPDSPNNLLLVRGITVLKLNFPVWSTGKYLKVIMWILEVSVMSDIWAACLCLRQQTCHRLTAAFSGPAQLRRFSGLGESQRVYQCGSAQGHRWPAGARVSDWVWIRTKYLPGSPPSFQILSKSVIRKGPNLFFWVAAIQHKHCFFSWEWQ